MRESEKIIEAQYFYSQMLKEACGRDSFSFNLSAFLSAGRSVLQYACKEARGKKNGQGWYDSQLNRNTVVKFFKDKRDINIHAEPVSVQANVSIGFSETLQFSASLSVVVRDSRGNIRENRSEPSPTPPASPPAAAEPPIIKTRYVFDDWKGNEDIPSLCKRYLDELEIIVADGRANGFLT